MRNMKELTDAAVGNAGLARVSGARDLRTAGAGLGLVLAFALKGLQLLEGASADEVTS